VLSGFLQGSHHYGKGFGRAILSGTQRSDRAIVRGIAGQEETAQSFDSHDFPLPEKLTGGHYRVGPAHHIAPVINQLDARTAFRAGIGLGVEAAVKGIVIFRLAPGAHLEVAHGGAGAIVWHALDDGKPRATIGAVGKRIAIAAVFRIQDLVKTGLAGGDVWRNELVFASLSLALPNFKAFVADRAMIFNSYVFDVGQRRGFRLQFLLKLPDSFGLAFYLDLDVFRSVVDPALEVVLDSQSIDERPEAHALNNAPDTDRS